MFKFLRVPIGIDEIVMNVMRQTLQKKNLIFTNQILCGCFRAWTPLFCILMAWDTSSKQIAFIYASIFVVLSVCFFQTQSSSNMAMAQKNIDRLNWDGGQYYYILLLSITNPLVI